MLVTPAAFRERCSRGGDSGPEGLHWLAMRAEGSVLPQKRAIGPEPSLTWTSWDQFRNCWCFYLVASSWARPSEYAWTAACGMNLILTRKCRFNEIIYCLTNKLLLACWKIVMETWKWIFFFPLSCLCFVVVRLFLFSDFCFNFIEIKLNFIFIVWSCFYE